MHIQRERERERERERREKREREREGERKREGEREGEREREKESQRVKQGSSNELWKFQVNETNSGGRVFLIKYVYICIRFLMYKFLL